MHARVSWLEARWNRNFTCKAGREGGQALAEVVHRLGQLQPCQVDPEDLLPPRDVRAVDADLTVKSAAPALP